MIVYEDEPLRLSEGLRDLGSLAQTLLVMGTAADPRR